LSFLSPQYITYPTIKLLSTSLPSFSDEQERVQKKTFVNWINSYLGKRVPPLKITNLMDDLRDGTKLLALLEVLSGEKLPTEKGRILRRPHYLSNCNTALEFLRSKRVSGIFIICVLSLAFDSGILLESYNASRK
jgi:hypothetical protein